MTQRSLVKPDEQWVRLYIEGNKSIRDIALIYGCSTTKVRSYLVASGVKIRPRGGNKRMPFVGDDERILSLWEQGFCAAHISETLHWSKSYVARRLTAHGVERNRRGQRQFRLPQEEIERVVFLYESMKMDALEIARILGWGDNKSRVYRRLRAGGVLSRGKKEATALALRKRELVG